MSWTTHKPLTWLQITSIHPTLSHVKGKSVITPNDFPVDTKDTFPLCSSLDCVKCALPWCFCLAEHRRYSHIHVKLISFIPIYNSHCKEGKKKKTKKTEEKDSIHSSQLEHNAFLLCFLGKLPQSSLLPQPFPVTLLSRCSSIIR